MTVRRIAILCLNPWEAPGPFQPFSFAAHRIEAALAAHPAVDAEVRVIEGRGQELEAWLAAVADFAPDLVGFSAYLWSAPTFVEMARRLKAVDPGLKVVFGGPSARPEVLALPPGEKAEAQLVLLAAAPGKELVGPRDGDRVVRAAANRPHRRQLQLDRLARLPARR